ncbi:MAG: transaldolase family protein [Elainellaceae cyanobacterium]
MAPLPSSPPHLRLYLDTADPDRWADWLPTGIFYGVTSNPLLLERAGQQCSVENLTGLAHRAFQLGAQEVQMQTWGATEDDLVITGQHLAAIDNRIVVKVPITRTGTAAAARLAAQGIRITMTAVYARQQVLIAAALGAEYVAPYLGRINDMGLDGREELSAMQRSLDGIQSSTRILTASIRHVEDLAYLSAEGLDTFTFSVAIAEALFDVPATLEATASFEQSALRMT